MLNTKRRERGARFLQSAREFPALVTLGEKAPSWGLSRWSGTGLRFVPPDEEGFALRGDRRHVTYRGKRRSHRFTILDHQHFEYDIILNREPESSRILIAIEGWEGFDFFRQPDNIGPDYLRGSYAVYKKETLPGEGTGKLCHIHRPKIVDARGRWAWGDLWIDRGLLTIRLPEGWLGEAKYPVTVDPVVGSSVVGAYRTFEYLSWNDYMDNIEDYGDDVFAEYAEQLVVELGYNLALNKCRAPAQLQGIYNTYAYIWDFYRYAGREAYEYDILPFLYSDHNGKPDNLLAFNSTWGNILASLGSPDNFTSRWVQSTLTINGTVAANTDVWFGFWGWCGYLAFDYGGVLLQTDSAPIEHDDLSNYSSLYEMAVDYGFDNISYCQERFAGEAANMCPGARYDFKLSMYLGVPATYTRTLFQGASLSDVRKQAGSYKRSATQTVRGTGAAKGIEGFCRGIAQTVKNTMGLQRFPTLLRKLAQGVGAGDALGRFLSVIVKAAQTAGAGSGAHRTTQAKRGVADTGRPGTAIGRKQDFWRGIAHGGGIAAAALRSADYAKRLQETAGSAAGAGAVRDVALKLAEAVAALYATQAGAEFWRGIASGVSVGSVMGRMALFFRVLFGSAGSGDSRGSFIDRMRVVQDVGAAGDATGHVADYLRGLFVEAGSLAGTSHKADYHRRQQDMAHSDAVPLRQLFVFIRLLTSAYIRDYIIGRFLKSKEEAVIKSPVCREIVLDSRLH